MVDLSWVEMRLVMTRLIWNFDIVATDDLKDWDPTDNMKNMRAYSTWEKPQLMVKLVPRKF